MLLRLSEAADLLGVSVETLRNLKKAGLIAVIRTGVKKGYRIEESELQRYIDSRREHPGKDTKQFSPRCKPVKLRHLR